MYLKVEWKSLPQTGQQNPWGLIGFGHESFLSSQETNGQIFEKFQKQKFSNHYTRTMQKNPCRKNLPSLDFSFRNSHKHNYHCQHNYDQKVEIQFPGLFETVAFLA